MFHYETTREVAYAVSDIMEDIWHKRTFLQEKAYFVFRIDASDFDADNYTNVFVHYLITDGRWHMLLSDEQFDVTYEQLTERIDFEEQLTLGRIESWRHYAFGDLAKGMIQEALDEKIKDIGLTKINQITLWDTFPAQRLSN
jgi:hypothetical protein